MSTLGTFDECEKMTLKQFRAEAGEITIRFVKVWKDDKPLTYAIEYSVCDDVMAPGSIRRADLMPVGGPEEYRAAHDLFVERLMAAL